ncbi:uncharacterized protein LOC122310270 [Carya illinoinensis]|uniref:uncharacterized protein LOC122310270 n=1 Tax=Carya illinoinensis TaxID=32201 RepID=UPI001C723C1F|nr:uncharacterized protein LOC122310270 [Carya illinoinensis]
MAIKLDMSKAYDQVEWKFLEAIMKKMGFGCRWINLVMDCITSVSYSVIVNGQYGSSFKPEKGIRQGDPLSPYLSLLCAERLNALLTQAETRQEIKGVAACRGGVRISHLLFVDDSLFSNTSAARRAELANAVGVSASNSYDKYLGLPSMVGWKISHVKSCDPSCPNIYYECVKLSKRLLKETNSMLGKFWWGNCHNQNKIHWKNWKNMGKSKKDGELGFRDLEFFNCAMLAKQVWRMLNNSSSLVATILRQKYCRNGNVFKAKKGNNSSMIWQSLWSSIPLLKASCLWRVRDVINISIWHVKWIPNKIKSLIQVLDSDATVSELINKEEGFSKKEVLT